ncbi:mucin-17-like isoform X2 [Anopheles cruzii]|uniref:mucin-17-like isoform X2 n=1 Tax=Anopheles cruzii TaxID=68878 RepID=UPI0022EC67C0|nr:mucin-17-like isoform X2 [Anopheles cruzii]
MVRLLVLLLCVSMATTQKPGNFNFKEKGFKSNQNYDIDPQVLEIQRQNLITQKILQRYLERRLHPGRKPQIHVPSVEEILPKPFASLPSERNVRQQNQSAEAAPGASSSNSSASSESRYDLFNGRNGRQYDPDDEANRDPQYDEGDDDYRDEASRDLDQYDELSAALADSDRFDIESLQSGESEHVDSFYRDKYFRQRASQLSAGDGGDNDALDDVDFEDDPEVSVLSEITNEIRLQQESVKKVTTRDLQPVTGIRRPKRQAINSRTSRRSRPTVRETPTITNRVDARYYTAEDYVDYQTTPVRANKNLRDNYSEYRLQSKNRNVAIEPSKTTRPRPTTAQTTLARNAARSRNRNTLKSLAYKPNVYNANNRRTTFTLSAYNKPTGRSTGSRRGSTNGRNSYKEETEPARNWNRFGQATPTAQDWRRKTVSLGSSNIQPSTAALTVTFFLPTDTTVSVVANSKTEISLIKTTTTSIEEICTSCFSLTQGPNGVPVHVLNKEITSFNNDGLFEITKFILSSTPTTTVSVSQNTFRGRSTAYSATISTTIYEATPFVETKGKTADPNSVLSNAPLANILLSQLLLGNLGGAPEPNFIPRPTEFLHDPNRYQLIVTTTTDYKTHVKEVVQTVTQTKSIVLPITFQGREILTTVYESDVTSTLITSYITETLTIPTTSTVRIQPTVNPADDISNKLSLLLPLLEERERQNRLLSAIEPSLPVVSTAPPTLSPTPTATSAVSKVYVSGQHPGEFSVSFTTIFNT